MLNSLRAAVFCAAICGSAVLSAAPIPQSLISGGELVDAKNGFAIRIDQPNVSWNMADGLGANFSKYVGIDARRRIVFTVFVDRRRYSEQDAARSARYAEGLKSGMQSSGWMVVSMSASPTEIPRRNSYRYKTEATHANGAHATFVEHVTSPDNLYSICVVLPPGADATVFQELLRSFRLLKP